MSTSDQHEHGPLTRKQLREIRLTGSTPVITPEEAAAAAEAAPPAPPLPRPAEPADVPPAPVAPVAEEPGGAGAPLTRRQVREQERMRTASVPVVGDEAADPAETADAPEAEAEVPQAEVPEAEVVDSEVPAAEAPDGDTPAQEPVAEAPTDAASASTPDIVSGVPQFSTAADTAGDDDDVEEELVIDPVPATEAADSVGVIPLEVSDEPVATSDDVAAVFGAAGDDDQIDADDDDVLADVDDADDDDVAADPRPTVNSSFGEGLLADATEPHAPFRPSFDELLTVGDSTGSQHSAPNALIFTPSPGEGSLSGPVASTGEILVTGSYELPRGLGSQGHAHGTTDGKDVDAVLIDGELPPASSPTPIAASSAVSTIKPAGEVIRPPAPEKGNRLTLVLTIIVGGLALALAVALVVAISTNVF